MISRTTNLTIKLQAEEHDIIDDENFHSIGTYILHLMHQSDYERAQKLVRDKIVLDLGCNSGYGTNILSRACNRVIGADVSQNAIETATAKYQRDNLSFLLIDGLSLPFESASFDVITSFQVVEHIADYATYFREIRRVLKPDGILLLTTPNAAIRVKPGAKPWNPFHVHEFRSNEFRTFLQGYFPSVKVIGQFATDKAYAIEFNRCIQQRDQIDIESKQGFKRWIVSCIPPPIANRLRRLRNHFRARQTSRPSNESKEQFSTLDIFYRATDLDRSLSLIGFCSSSSIVQDKAAQAFLANN